MKRTVSCPGTSHSACQVRAASFRTFAPRTCSPLGTVQPGSASEPARSQTAKRADPGAKKGDSNGKPQQRSAHRKPRP